MKRLLIVGAAIILSLLVGWASAYMASRVEFGMAERAWPGCREAGRCEAPLWLDGLLLAWFIGPPLMFGSVAFVGCGKNWSLVRWLVTLAVMSVLTAGFYAAWYVHSG